MSWSTVNGAWSLKRDSFQTPGPHRRSRDARRGDLVVDAAEYRHARWNLCVELRGSLAQAIALAPS